MKNLIHKKNKYFITIIGLLGLIPYGLPIMEKNGLVAFFEIKTIDLTIWYGITILCFLSGVYWGLSINIHIKNNSKLNYLLPALSIIPFISSTTPLTTPLSIPECVLSPISFFSLESNLISGRFSV